MFLHAMIGSDIDKVMAGETPANPATMASDPYSPQGSRYRTIAAPAARYGP